MCCDSNTKHTKKLRVKNADFVMLHPVAYVAIAFFFLVAQQPKPGLDLLIVAVSRLHADLHTAGRTCLNERSARHRCCYLHERA